MAAKEEKKPQKEEPIIIKKKRGHGGHGHHGGAWKVAYADFVTAMMAFFIVMWILASSEKVKQLVTSYFNDPGAFNFLTGEKAVPVDLNLQPQRNNGEGEGKDTKDSGQKFIIKFDKEMADSVVSKLRQKAIEDSLKAAERIGELMSTLKKQFNEIIAQQPEFTELINSVKIELTNEGLRIELIETSESVFFEIGSARLKPKAIEILSALAKQIGRLTNYIEIEGHTDSRGYKSKTIYSNWELSSDRANSARQVLEKSGLWEGQVSKVTGFADRKLRYPESPFDFSNRRVSILIKHLSVSDILSKNQNEKQ